MGFVLLLSLMLYPIAIGITGLTGGLTVYFRKKLRNAGNLNKDAIGDLRFIAYISLILTFWSVPVYNIAYSLLSGSLSYGCAGISEPVFKIQIGIYIKSTLDTVFVHNFYESFVKNNTVIVA